MARSVLASCLVLAMALLSPGNLSAVTVSINVPGAVDLNGPSVEADITGLGTVSLQHCTQRAPGSIAYDCTLTGDLLGENGPISYNYNNPFQMRFTLLYNGLPKYPNTAVRFTNESISGWPYVYLHQGENVSWAGHWGWSGYSDKIFVDNGYWVYINITYDLRQLLLPGPIRGAKGDNPNTIFHQAGLTACQSQGLPQYAVNTSFLNLVVEDTDLAYRSFGHDVALRRVWNMLPSVAGLFGNGWTFQYESTLDAYPPGDGGVTINKGSGQVVSYSVSGSQGQGTGTVTVNYACDVLGPSQTLTGVVNESSQTGYYLLTDKQAKLTSRYDYVSDLPNNGPHRYRLTAITDRNGNALSLTYDVNGRLHQLTDASDRTITFTVDADGRCTQFTSFDNKTAAFQYSAAGNLIQSTDLAGNVSTFAYDANNYLTAMTTAGKTTSFAYGSTSGVQYLSSVTDPAGKVWTYSFVSGGARITEPDGGAQTFANSYGRTTTITDALGHTTTTTYNAQGLPASITDPRGKVTTLAYDAAGNLINRTDPLGHATVLSYDSNHNLTGVADPLNQIWSFTYDAQNNLDTMSSPLGRATLYAHDARGLLRQKITPGGDIHAYTYDSHGNRAGITDPLGNHRSLTYDDHGLNVVSETDPRGNVTSFQYDDNRRTTRTTFPDSAVLQYGYDCCALSSETLPTGSSTTYQRDPLLRITKTIDPLGKTTSFAFNAEGDMLSVTDPMSRMTVYSRDAAHRTTAVTNPLGKSVAFSLDAAGNLTGVTNERGKTLTMAYDDLGNLASVTDPLGRKTADIARNAAGQVSSVTNARGQAVTFARDAEGRVLLKKYGADTAAAFTYNANGHLASMTDISGTKSFTYDAAGRVTGIGYPDGLALTLAYDAAGNVSAMTYPGGLVVNAAHNVRNRPSSVTFGGKSVSLTYDPSGNLIGETRSNGVQSVYGYDAAGRLTSLSHTKGPTSIASLAYSRDDAGQVTGQSGTWPTAPRLASGQTNATYNNADGVTTWKNDAYAYDLDGNLTSVSGSRALVIAYDPENHPTSVAVNGVVTTHMYDGQGNRVASQTGSSLRRFHHDPWGRLLCETNAAGQVIANYIWAGNRLVAFGAASGGFVYFHQDKTGNILALTDAAGNTVAAFAYAPYGAVANRTGSVVTPFTYAGAYGVMDEGAGLFFMSNRYYDAITGRFLTRDPIRSGGGYNLYRYVSDNPVTGIDPMGLSDVAEGTYDICLNRPPAHLKSSAASDTEVRLATWMGIGIGLGLTAQIALPALAGAAAVEAGTAAAATTAEVGITVAATEEVAAANIVAQSGIVPRLIQQSLSGGGEKTVEYLYWLSQQGREGQLMLRAISNEAGALINSGSSNIVRNQLRNIFHLANRGFW